MLFNKLAFTAVALAASTLAISANAQSSVTLYGVADAYVQHVNGANTNLNRVQSGGLSGSRFGLRGNEDLGGGLRAMFVLESGINLDTGTSGQNAFWGRQAYVGIANQMGQISLGRQYGSTYMVSDIYSEFSNVRTGASTALIGGFGGYEPINGTDPGTATALGSSATDNGGPARVNNSIKLETASFSGFKLGLLGGLGEAASGARNTRLVDVYARYNAGPVDAMLSIVDDKAAASATLSNRLVRTISAAGGYTFGDFRATAGYMSVNDRTAINADGAGAWIGGDYTLGANKFKAQYVQSRTKGSLADAKAQAFGVGYQYDLSKRTSLYSTVTYFKNDGDLSYNRASFATTGTAAGVFSPTDRKATEFVAGIRHVF